MTELVFIIDRSGSMSGLEKDTVGGFNSTVLKQKKTDGDDAYVSLVLFNEQSYVVWDREPISNIPAFREDQYCPAGCTALLDAVGDAIHHIGNVHRYARKEDVPKKTVFVIITDGMENASRRYDYRRIREMISHKKEKYDWEFLFLGANIDAECEAERIGINRDRAVNYHCDREGVDVTYKAVAEFCCNMRAMHAGSSVDNNWRKNVDEDYRRRK